MTHTYSSNGKYTVEIEDVIDSIGVAYSSFVKNKAC